MDYGKKVKHLLLGFGSAFALVAMGFWMWVFVSHDAFDSMAFILIGLLFAALIGFYCLGAWAAIRTLEECGSMLKYDKASKK